MQTVVFAGGGTGGHIYPGLAVIAELQKIEHVRVVWIGSSKGMDRSIVENAGIEFYGILCGKLRRYASFKNFTDIFRILVGFVQAFFLLLKLRPTVLFSKGGFVSVPPCFSARLLHIPVVTHECDFSPGLATRINARSASRILVSYEKTVGQLPVAYRSRAVVTGNPVRPEFYTANPSTGKSFLGLDDKPSLPLLVVVGGSLGARQVNTIVTDLLPELTKYFIVVHQTGKGNEADSEKLRLQYPGQYLPYAYINKEMPDVLAAADVVLSRAGANSLWECAVLGKAMVLIPLELAGSRGDQLENARYFAAAGAAQYVTGENATAQNVLAILTNLATDKVARDTLGLNARNCAAGCPAADIAVLLQNMMNEQGKEKK